MLVPAINHPALRTLRLRLAPRLAPAPLLLLAIAAPCLGSASRAEVPVVTTIATFESGTGGLTVAPDGTLYSSDFGSQLGGRGEGGHRVFRVTPAGEVSLFATGLRGASGSEWGSDGALYQSNIGGNTVSRISSDGTVETFAAEGFRNPVGIAQIPTADGSFGDLLVANCGAGSVQRVRADGSSETWVHSDLLACPNGIAVARDGTVYVANFANGDIVRITADGEASVLATIEGDNNGHLVLHGDALWVAARSAQRIVRVELEGRTRGHVTVVAGSGRRGGADGPGPVASFCFPNDLGFSPDGRYLYVNEVADEDSEGRLLAPTRIRRIDLAGVSWRNGARRD